MIKKSGHIHSHVNLNTCNIICPVKYYWFAFAIPSSLRNVTQIVIKFDVKQTEEHKKYNLITDILLKTCMLTFCPWSPQLLKRRPLSTDAATSSFSL